MNKFLLEIVTKNSVPQGEFRSLKHFKSKFAASKTTQENVFSIYDTYFQNLLGFKKSWER